MENRNRNIWIIVVVVVILLCCLLAALAAGIAAWLGLFTLRSVDSGVLQPGFEFDQIIEHQEMSFEVGDAPALLIDNFAGNVRIRAGGDGLISADVSRRAGRSANLRNISIEPSQEGDTVRIVTRRTSAAMSNVAVNLEITVPAGLDKAAVEAAVLADESVQRHLAGQAVKKLIVVPGRIVNVVV